MKSGDKVLCIRDNWKFITPDTPVKGRIYTVTVAYDDGYIELKECGEDFRYAPQAFELLNGTPHGSCGPVIEHQPDHLEQV
jgi:hypothetical protein